MLRATIAVPDACCRHRTHPKTRASRCRAKAAPRSVSGRTRRSARCRSGTWPTSTRRSTRRRSSAISSAPRPNASPSRRPTRASSPSSRPARSRGDARRGGEALRGARRPARPADLLRGPGPRRQHHRSGARQILRRRAGAHHRGVAAPPVLHARAQPHRRRRARGRDGGSGARPLPAVDRGRAQGKAVPARRPRRAAVPREVGDRRGRLEPAVRRDDRGRCASRSTARRSRIEPTLNLLQDPSEKKRQAAAEALAKTFKENLRLFTLITNTLAKDKEISDRWRGFKDVADARHLSNRVEPEVVDALVVGGARGLSAAVAPLLRAEGQLVRQEAPAALGPQRAAAEGRAAHDRRGARRRTRCSPPTARSRRAWRTIAERFFARNWIDAPVRPGKPPGAFAHPTVPSAHPYVLLNYQGKPRDVMTLAHELGHGVHQVLAAPNGALMAPTPLTLAETASVFGEMLTFQKLLAETTDAKQRKAMLAAKVEDMINTVVRQIAFYTLRAQGPHRAPQRRAHRRAAGRDLAERAGREPRPGDRAQARLRDVLDLHPALHPFAVLRLRLCVRRLPGELALCGLREGRTRALPSAISPCSSAGGTKHHSELLKPFGLDARDPASGRAGLRVIERMIGELEALDARVPVRHPAVEALGCGDPPPARLTR